jgi:hypothetical protein
MRDTWLTLAIGIALTPLSTSAQPNERGRIDGSSAASFEASIVRLQNELPTRRREDFETALAVIWIRSTVASADADSDGDMDLDDIRLLEAHADALLTDIRRGNVVSAIEEREQDGYTAADYFHQLDGLGYDEVLSLAGRPSADDYQAAQARAHAAAWCNQSVPQSRVEHAWCDRFADERPGIDIKTGKTLNTAMQALNEQRYDDARAAVETLNLTRLSSYERSNVERMLFTVSYAQGKRAEAREHLLEALAAGGLNPQEVSYVLAELRSIDSQLSGGAP